VDAFIPYQHAAVVSLISNKNKKMEEGEEGNFSFLHPIFLFLPFRPF